MTFPETLIVPLVLLATWCLLPVPATRHLEPTSPTTPPSRSTWRVTRTPLVRQLAAPGVASCAALFLGASTLAAAAVGGLLVFSAEMRKRRLKEQSARELRAALPDVVELIGLGIGSGGTVVLGLRLVVRLGPPAVREAFVRAVHLIELGETRRVALSSVAEELSPDYRPFVDVLVSAERNGAAISDILDRLGSEALAAQQRRADEQARRTPVKLLAPLVVCNLPAVLVGTVVPLVYLAFGSIKLPGG